MVNSKERRWQKAQQVELDAWKDFGNNPRHFSAKYWDWELSHFGLNLEWFQKFPSHAKFLEVGCGPYGMIHFIGNGERYGLEPLANELKKFIKVKSGVELYSGVGEKMPFADNEFDVVILFNVIDHVMNPTAVLKECWRILRTSGVLLLNVNIVRQIPGMGKILGVLDNVHPHHWNLSEFVRLLGDNKISVKKVKCIPRRNYCFRLEWKNGFPKVIADLRIGNNMYHPAKGSVFHHFGSNLLNLRADFLAVK